MNSSAGDKYILLVEDNPDDVALTKFALKKGQIFNRLVNVSDGEEALDFLFRRGKYADRDTDGNPLLILLDLKMPKLDGLEVLKQIRACKRTSCIPVLVLTSSTEEKDKSESIRLGANSYIPKPTGLTSLIEMLQQIKTDWLS